MKTDMVQCHGYDDIVVWVTQFASRMACVLEAQELKNQNPHWRVVITYSDGRKEEL